MATCRWRGRTFTVSLAKRHYMEWLQSEWREAEEAKIREQNEKAELEVTQLKPYLAWF